MNFGVDNSKLTAFSNNSNATKSDLEGIIIDYTDYKNQPNYLVSDAIEFAGVYDTTQDKVVLLAGLSYAYSWIDVKWTNKVSSPARFTLQSITACNLPKSLAIESRAGTTAGVYPPVTTEITGTCSVGSNSADAGLNSNSTYTCLLYTSPSPRDS